MDGSHLTVILETCFNTDRLSYDTPDSANGDCLIVAWEYSELSGAFERKQLAVQERKVSLKS